MEQVIIPNDITVAYVTASSFPAGIGAAFKKLKTTLPSLEGRDLYGISNPVNGNIVYRAGAEVQYEGEAKEYGLETFIIEAGQYKSQLIKDWHRDEGSIGRTFMNMLVDPHIDKNGACIEKYLSDKDVLCMVRLNSMK